MEAFRIGLEFLGDPAAEQPMRRAAAVPGFAYESRTICWAQEFPVPDFERRSTPMVVRMHEQHQRLGFFAISVRHWSQSDASETVLATGRAP